ncbi:MAG: glycosyltransferase family 4 protein [Planctomycetaceae bacterium]|nr:glycosyltransferase family 4 protein [Planctomycetaceae bacterium]
MEEPLTDPQADEGPLRVAALFSHPIQYFAPLMRALAAQPGVDLTVYYCSRQGLDEGHDPGFGVSFRWDVPLLGGYRSVFLPNIRGENGAHGFFRLINPSVIGELRRQSFDAILVHGYEHCTKWLAFWGARSAGMGMILRGESHLLDERPWHIRAAKRLALGTLMRMTSACAYIGEANRAFYRHHGTPEERLFFAPYAVDNDAFRAQHERLRPRREELRAALGASPEAPIVLACGKLIEKKQPLLLLRAFQQVRSKRPCVLVYAGDGVLRAEIERVVSEEEIPDVRITGFLNQSQIGAMYTAADCLALPSRLEPWGLVVNEAMNFGLPVVVSDRVGCAANLVRPGENGMIVDHRRPGPWAEALTTLASDAALRQAYGRRSREIVEGYSLEVCARALARAARESARRGSHRRGRAHPGRPRRRRSASRLELPGSSSSERDRRPQGGADGAAGRGGRG